MARLQAISTELNLSSAQLAVAREHGFASWARLKTEVLRRKILTDRDVDRLAGVLAEHPELATEQMRHWCDHPLGPTPLSFVAMLRYDTAQPVWRARAGTGAIGRMLPQAGAPVDGDPGDPETPLITAASYGDAQVVRVLIEAGADLDAAASPAAGGVPGGTALRHAAVFGITQVVDILVAAGARIGSISEAAAAGDITGWLRSDTPVEDRVRALVMAADHERLDVVDQLLDGETPIDASDGSKERGKAGPRGRSVAVLLSVLPHGGPESGRAPDLDQREQTRRQPRRTRSLRLRWVRQGPWRSWWAVLRKLSWSAPCSVRMLCARPSERAASPNRTCSVPR